MKVVILAGGFGTRMGDETLARPKPLIEIGGYPILWHIMSIYHDAGFSDFVVALGYRGEMVKEYFIGLQTRNNDLTVDLANGNLTIHERRQLNWKVHLVDTGEQTMTGGRVRRLAHLLRDETFMLTYGDGLADIDIGELLAFHRSHGKLATVTAVRPPARFGVLSIDNVERRVLSFNEKPQTSGGWINGGFFVFEPGALDYIDGDETPLERDPLQKLAADGQLFAYKLGGFWQPMDTLREKLALEDLWNAGDAPWRRPAHKPAK